MTRRTNARVAGVTFLVYIAVGVAPMVYAVGRSVNVVLSLVGCLSAFVLGVTLFAITRDEDRDIARVAMLCRVAEGVMSATFIPISLASRADAAAGDGLRRLLTSARTLNILVAATFFAVGSALFCFLLLRGRLIPVALAWLGVLASVLLVVALPLQIGDILTGPVTMVVWLPMLVFELTLAGWLIVKGTATPAESILVSE